MECSGGILKLLPGWWYDTDKLVVRFDHTASVRPCLNPKACSVVNATSVECSEHATGLLCAICEDGFVPDSSASDGRCKECVSSGADRWLMKLVFLVSVGCGYFFISIILALKPAPKLKLDLFLGVTLFRMRMRRARKRAALRLLERDPHAASLTSHEHDCVRKLIDKGEFNTVNALRRAAYGRHHARALLV